MSNEAKHTHTVNMTRKDIIQMSTFINHLNCQGEKQLRLKISAGKKLHCFSISARIMCTKYWKHTAAVTL